MALQKAHFARVTSRYAKRNPVLGVDRYYQRYYRLGGRNNRIYVHNAAVKSWGKSEV